MSIDKKTLSELAKVADVSLDEETREALAPRLKGLLDDANRVNAFMGPRRTVGPAVRFKHPQRLEEEKT